MSKYLDYFNKLYKEKEKQKRKLEFRLTESQWKLLKFLACGLTLREIADALGTNYNNIKKRTQNLYFKFGAADRYCLIKLAIEYGFITTKDIKPRFRKRFIKENTIDNINHKEISMLSEREKIFLLLLGEGKTQTEIITVMELYGTYPVWELKRSICAKLACENFVRAVYVAKKLGII